MVDKNPIYLINYVQKELSAKKILSSEVDHIEDRIKDAYAKIQRMSEKELNYTQLEAEIQMLQESYFAEVEVNPGNKRELQDKYLKLISKKQRTKNDPEHINLYHNLTEDLENTCVDLFLGLEDMKLNSADTALNNLLASYNPADWDGYEQIEFIDNADIELIEEHDQADVNLNNLLDNYNPAEWGSYVNQQNVEFIDKNEGSKIIYKHNDEVYFKLAELVCNYDPAEWDGYEQIEFIDDADIELIEEHDQADVNLNNLLDDYDSNSWNTSYPVSENSLGLNVLSKKPLQSPMNSPSYAASCIVELKNNYKVNNNGLENKVDEPVFQTPQKSPLMKNGFLKKAVALAAIVASTMGAFMSYTTTLFPQPETPASEIVNSVKSLDVGEFDTFNPTQSSMVDEKDDFIPFKPVITLKVFQKKSIQKNRRLPTINSAPRIIKKGDTVWDLCNHDIKLLRTVNILNPGKNLNKIFPGEKINFPSNF